MDDATCASIFIITFVTVEILWVKIMDDATCTTIFIIIFITCWCGKWSLVVDK